MKPSDLIGERFSLLFVFLLLLPIYASDYILLPSFLSFLALLLCIGSLTWGILMALRVVDAD